MENFISLSALQGFNILIPLITLPYILNVIGFEKYGVVVLANSLIVYFQAITDYSFKITATRDVSIFKGNKIKLNLIYSKVFFIKSLFLIFSCIIISGLIFIVPAFYEERLVFFCSMPLLVGYALFPDWFFQGIEKMKYITLLNLSIKIFFLITIFLFVKEEEDYWLYSLLQSCGFFIAGVLGQIIIYKRYSIRFVRIRFRELWIAIKLNFPIFINQFVPTLYNNTSGFLLGLISGDFYLGVFSAIRKIVDIILIFLNIISRVFFPYLNRRKSFFNKYKTYMLYLGTGMCIFPILFYMPIKWYLNLTYDRSFLVLSILSVGIIFFTLYDVFGTNYFLVRRKDKLVMKNTLIATVVSLLLVYPLISYFGVLGAAINLTLARALMGLGLYKEYKKQIGK
ncbi:MAG: oligosaccharide flippase family protein [Mesonia sp.]